MRSLSICLILAALLALLSGNALAGYWTNTPDPDDGTDTYSLSPDDTENMHGETNDADDDSVCASTYAENWAYDGSGDTYTCWSKVVGCKLREDQDYTGTPIDSEIFTCEWTEYYWWEVAGDAYAPSGGDTGTAYSRVEITIAYDSAPDDDMQEHFGVDFDSESKKVEGGSWLPKLLTIVRKVGPVTLGWDDSADSDNTFGDDDGQIETEWSESLHNHCGEFDEVYAKVAVTLYAKAETLEDAEHAMAWAEVNICNFDLLE